ncbi:RNA exonuclease 1 homolog [Coregonus clupeaformis]|uniref:RNA exonuclease 1 homolog n=1 Tax=Coregonus clupeaformis TaxID=59861 RepID=UPI001E1C5939|nr:RNA exonuclease 1 homolog [Coregonus clupeaformis]
MLRSTGFFRGIDCPFYTDSYNEESGKYGCNRPYCHFRHSKHRRASYGSNYTRKSKELYSNQKEQGGYDPFNPEVVRPEEQQNGEPAAATVDMGALELELVNRAIEEVRSEVEREKKKLSRIGDQEYDPSASSPKVLAKQPKPLSQTGDKKYDPTASSPKVVPKPLSGTGDQEYDPTTSSPKVMANWPKLPAVASHLAYDPGSYQMTTTADYNPTPRSSKYTLDSDSKDNHASSMEYVPTSVTKTALKKPAPRTRTPHLPSPPTSPKYSTNASSKNKYTVDNSKPSTDMEYDPLSNYSAKIAGKNKKDQRTGASKGEGKKRPHLSGTGKPSTDEEYVPTIKKPRQVIPDPLKYTASLSESDEESSGTEYRPTSLSRLQRRKSSSGLVEEASGPGKGERTEGALDGLKQQRRREVKEQEDSEKQEVARQKDRPETEKGPFKTSHMKSSKVEKVHKSEKESSKKSGGSKEKGAGDGKKISDSKKSSHETAKKDSKNQGKKEEEKSKIKDKSIDKGKEGQEGKRSDGKSKIRTDKVKGESSKSESEREKGGGDSKKLKNSDKEKDSSKFKEHKNGKHYSSGREKDCNKVSKGSSNSSNSSKDKVKKTSRSSSDGKTGKVKQRSLSHVDLFGDESAEEKPEEDDEEETIVRKSAAAFKRGRLNKRNATELTPSSSEDDDVGPDDDRGYDDMDGGGVDYSGLQVDLDFDLDDDPMEECLRIFNESKDVKTEDKGRQAKPSKDSDDEDATTDSNQTTLFPGQKKRVSHFSAKGSTEATPKPPPYRRLTAQEICYQRMQIAQQQAAQLAAAVKTASTPRPRPRPSPSPFPGERKRVAHRPTPLPSSSKSGLAEAKLAGSRVLSPTRTLPGGFSVKAQTSAGILSKTTTTIAQKRVAHTPTMKSSAMKRPVIPTEFGAKVPTNVRQRYLNNFIDECMKFCPSEDLAFQMALDEEKVVYDRSSSKNIYLNVAVNTLKKLRSKSISPTSPVARSPAALGNRKAQSHEEVLGGRLAAKTSFTINRTGKQQEEKLSGVRLYRKLRDYLMTEEQLQEHGYPRPHPERSGRAVVHNVPEKKNVDPFAKVCCRCGAEYRINANGNCVRKEECNHHWGRLRRHKVSGGWETNYNCCSGSVGSPGCSVSKQHVQDGRKESLDSYVQTFEKQLPPDGNGGVYALDCEMCYTKQGLELTRVTVINSELKVIYDTFVKPESKVVDYNTRFSGVTEEDLENATITLRDVQAVILNMFSAESILIGHSLESDLFALKVIHSTVVDTAIVFPHRLGLPYKRALRNLMADHLKRIIQDSVEGHDSSEDACACMELMIWKIREDAKVKR